MWAGCPCRSSSWSGSRSSPPCSSGRRPWAGTSTPSAATKRRRGWPGSTSIGVKMFVYTASGFLAVGLRDHPAVPSRLRPADGRARPGIAGHRRLDHRRHQSAWRRRNRARRGPRRGHHRRARERHRLARDQYLRPAGGHRSGHPAGCRARYLAEAARSVASRDGSNIKGGHQQMVQARNVGVA